jgi:hypothetical protein
MTRTERRLAEIEAAVAGIAPPTDSGPAWLRWCSTDELTRLDELFRRWDSEQIEPTEAQRWEVASIECAATARMISGAPREGEGRYVPPPPPRL